MTAPFPIPHPTARYHFKAAWSFRSKRPGSIRVSASSNWRIQSPSPPIARRPRAMELAAGTVAAQAADNQHRSGCGNDLVWKRAEMVELGAARCAPPRNTRRALFKPVSLHHHQDMRAEGGHRFFDPVGFQQFDDRKVFGARRVA